MNRRSFLKLASGAVAALATAGVPQFALVPVEKVITLLGGRIMFGPGGSTARDVRLVWTGPNIMRIDG